MEYSRGVVMSREKLDKMSKEGITETSDKDKTQVDSGRNHQEDSSGNR